MYVINGLPVSENYGIINTAGASKSQHGAIIINGDDNMKDYIRSVQYYETDKMGIVHHSNYIKWFEEARIFYMKEMGFLYKEMEDKGIMIPVVGINVKYKSGAAYGDTVGIKTRVNKISAVKLDFGYEIYDVETGETRVMGSSNHCFVNESFRPCSIKKKFPEFYEKCIEILGNEK